MKKQINSKNAPAAIGAYSQAIAVDKTIYCSGQIPLDVATGKLVADDFAQQTHQVFKNLSEVINEAGGSMQDFVKLTIYLTDLSNFAELNDIMAEYFNPPFPARASIQISALPLGALVEIDGIAQLS